MMIANATWTQVTTLKFRRVGLQPFKIEE